MVAARLRTDARTQPDGLGNPSPRFSWQPSAEAELHRLGYRVQVSSNPDFQDQVWESQPVSPESAPWVTYSGPALKSSTRYWWRIGPGAAAAAGPWSEAASFSTGVLNETGWRGQWITDSVHYDESDNPVLYFRGEIDLPEGIRQARAYASALGWYHLVVNGTDLTGPALVPRFTPFEKEVEYQSYDATPLLAPGRNVIGLVVADGRFRGRLGYLDRRAVYGNQLSAYLQLEVDLEDGTTQTFTTDQGWTVGSGLIVRSDPKHGEQVDLRRSAESWMLPGPAAGFRAVDVLPTHPRRLVAEQTARVTQVGELEAKRIWRSRSGRLLIDFGQNFAGVVRVRLPGSASHAGTKIRLTHSEVLTPAGELDTRWILHDPRHPWFQRDEFILGHTSQWVQPTFTVHGFRYVELDGLTGELGAEDVKGIVLSSALDQAGTFACSDGRLNKLYENVVWSVRSNFTDTPTDCPTRERSGWTGDAQAFLPTATGVLDVESYMRRYASSMALEQMDDGRVPPFIPAESTSETDKKTMFLGRMLANSSGWGDAAVTIPWNLYQYYGDPTVLADQYESMTRWVDYVAHRARNRRGMPRLFSPFRAGRLERYIVDSGFQWGEWLRPGATGVLTRRLDGTLRGAPVATAYFAESARILALTAELLGRTDDASRYKELAANVRTAWQKAFIRRNGKIGSDRQDEYVRALAFDLIPEAQRGKAITRLVELIEDADYHLGTGFLSTPLLLPVLTDIGRADLANRILLQTTSPSWLYQVSRGATTIWETWEGHDEQGNGTQSHNHFTFGSVAQWLREYLLGVRPTSPGYREFLFNPTPSADVTSARGWVQTPYGRIEASWTADDGQVQATITVPTGTTARVQLGTTTATVGPGTHHLAEAQSQQPSPSRSKDLPEGRTHQSANAV